MLARLDPRPGMIRGLAALAVGGMLCGTAVHPAYAADGIGESFDSATCIDLQATDPSTIPTATWAQDRLGIPRVHDLATGKGVTIAVIDTGIDLTANPVLLRDGRPVITETYNFAGYDKVRSGETGRRTDCAHGTRVAALIAGQRQVGSGVNFVGLAPDAKIISMRALQSATPTPSQPGGQPQQQSEPLEPTIKAVRKAIELKVDVISISQQGTDSFEYRQAINDAIGAGIVVVAAAGNHGGDKAAPYPASYRDVIAVGMSDINDKPHPMSQFHDQLAVTVGAPGVEVLTGNPSGPAGQSWQTDTGTSFAAPLVSATVALMLERNPRLTPAQVKRRLQHSADPPAAAVPDKQLGHGIVNPYRALTDVDTGTPGPTPPPVPSRAPDPTRVGQTSSGGRLAVVLGLASVGGIGLATALYVAYPFGRRRGWKAPR